MKKNITRLLSLLLLLGIIFNSCQHESAPNEGKLPGGDGDIQITLTIRVPGINTHTRSLGDIEETHIETVDILAFAEDNGTEKYIYHTHATDIENSVGSVNEKEFRAMLLRSSGDKPQRIVVLANMRDEIEAVKDNFLTTKTKQEILDEITFATDGVWNATSASDFRPLPMWGESEGTFVLTDNTTSDDVGKIYLIRGVARVDVGIMLNSNDVPEGLGSLFKISDIKLYNTKSTGSAAPDVANFDNQEKKVTAPSLPNSVNVNTVLGYELNPPGDGLVKTIYISESDNNQINSRSEATCLLIGGYYNSATEKTWYRIDLLDKTKTDGTMLDVLRNHRYRVNITSVDGPGYDDEATAFSSQAVNMNTEIIAWDEGDLNEIVFDGQYQLSVSTSIITVPREGFAKPLRIFTDYVTWSIDEKPSWVTLTENSGVGGVMKEIGVGAQPSDVERTGEMFITAGRLKKKITIVQTLDSEFAFDVTPLLLEFGKTPQVAKTITVTTMPADLPRTFTVKPGGNIAWTTFPADGTAETVYSFLPSTNTTGNILESTVVVTVLNGSTPVSKEVIIRQTATGIIFGATPSNNYPVLGGNGLTFTASSNVHWMVTAVDAPSGMITMPVNVIQNPGDNLLYSFDLTPNNTFENRVAQVTFGSPDPDFLPQSIDIIQAHNTPQLISFNPTQIHFGEAATSQTVTFTTNTDWQFTTDGNYARVVASALPAAGSTQQGGEPSNPIQKQVTFTPVYNTSGGTGVPAAGSESSTTVTFTSLNHPGNPTTQPIILKRTIPSFFDNVRVKSPTGETIAKAGERVTVEASSNAAWSIRSSTGQTKSQTAGAYGTKSIYVDIPSNAGAQRNVEIYYTYKGVETLLKTFTQIGGNVVTSFSENIPNPLPGDGMHCAIQFQGTFQNLKVRAIRVNNSAVLAEGTIPIGSYSIELKVPGNFTDAPYQVRFQYEDINGWQNIKTVDHPNSNFGLGTTGRLVAKQNLSGMLSWVNALGIDSKYSTIQFGASSEYTATKDTGCNAYYEGSPTDPATGKGKWKVPSWNELGSMKSHTTKLGMPTDREYWSTQENIANYSTARGYSFTNEFNSYSSKGTLYYVRCVRKRPQ